MDRLVSVKDFEEQASHLLDKNARGYYNSGANHELALRQNQEMFGFVKISPRILRNVSQVCLKARLLGRELALPFGIAPTAMHGLAHSGAEKNTFRAADKLGTVVTLSTLSTTSMEDAVQAAPEVPRLFQLYVTKNREIAQSLVRDAEALGFAALVLTVDAPQLGKREADERNKFHLPPHLKLAILEKFSRFQVTSSEGSGLLKLFSDQIDASLEWEDAKWLQSITKLPVILKGIQCSEDAELAVSHGFKHLWVTNHGGRQLSDVRSTVEILPEVVEVKRRNPGVEVYVDGGIRYGADIFKCLALGADFVFLGRPLVWANAVGGFEGQVRLLEILKQELRLAMVLAGTASIAQINSSYVINYLQPRPRL